MARATTSQNQDVLFPLMDLFSGEEESEAHEDTANERGVEYESESGGLLGRPGERQRRVQAVSGRGDSVAEEHRAVEGLRERALGESDAAVEASERSTQRPSAEHQSHSGEVAAHSVHDAHADAVVDEPDRGTRSSGTGSDRPEGLAATSTGTAHQGQSEGRSDAGRSDSVHGGEQPAGLEGSAGSGSVSAKLGVLRGGSPDRRERALPDLTTGQARPRWNPGTTLHVPSGAKARFHANLAALDLLQLLEREERGATPQEQQVLAGWSSWGAIPEVFDEQQESWASERAVLRDKLSASQWDAARTTTLNAHYTDPQIAQVMWAALQQAGFAGGPVIEPGCGAGTFIGLAPQAAQMVGVELDPVTARIASYLYPDAAIHAYGYEKLIMPEGSAALAIGNVPFGNFRVHDPRFNAAKLSINNHFIAKSLRLVAPGGYAAFITSSFTLDAATSTARQEIAKYGDLVSAVRLPNGAFKEVAGTDVLTDVLVFRRRPAGQAPEQARLNQWMSTGQFVVDGEPLMLNQWFIDHPKAMLGTPTARMNQFGQHSLHVTAAANTAQELRARLDTDLAVAAASGDGYLPVLGEQANPVLDHYTAAGLHAAPLNADAVIGQVRVTATGQGLERFGVDGLWEDVALPAKNRGARLAEYRDLISIKQTARTLIDAQRTGTMGPDERESLRTSLLTQYEGYVHKFGPINRFTLRPGTRPSAKKIASAVAKIEAQWRRDLDPELSAAERKDYPVPSTLREQWVSEVSEVEDVRVQEHTVALRQDPDFGLLLSVERFDDELMEARPSLICYEDLLSSNVHERAAQNPADALAMCLDEQREVNLSRIGQLLGIEESQVREALGDLVYEDPATGELVSAVHYLSGDILAKIQVAQEAVAVGRSQYEGNLSALQRVRRTPVEHYEINTKPGGQWISPEDYERFCLDTFKVTAEVTMNPLSKTWEVQGPPLSKFAADVQHTFGVGRKKSALWLLEQVMNNRSLRITKTIEAMRPDGSMGEKVVEDRKATMVARAKAKSLTAAFATWLYADDERRVRVVENYNRRFNSYVAPDYSALAEHAALPGLAEKFVPHTYQREAVARIVNEPTVLLDHVVGAGKTGTMVMAAMELRRTGIARKPWMVVPNHLVDQIGREFKEWYPASSVLTIPTGVDETQRRRYIAASATGDWDAVIVPFSTFEKIGVDPAKSQAWLAEEIAVLRNELAKKSANTSEKSTRVTVKRMEGAIKRLEERYEALNAHKDTGLTFEETGCDYLFVDEAHSFKNLRRSSDFQELAHTGSHRASDLDFKLRSLRETKTMLAQAEGINAETYLPAVATFATGTPVANSLAEMWVMQHYLRPDLLEKAGLETVDAWGNQFTTAATKVEMSPAGTEFVARERLAKFVNVPELLALSNQFTSVVTSENITAKLPELVGGKRAAMVREASSQVLDYVQQLAERAENLPDDPSVDNLLKITNDGRSVALDPRLVGLDADPDGGRVSQVAEQVLRIHEQTRHNTYLNSFEEVEPVPGGLQIIFCDRAIPNAEGRFSIYDAITEELVAGGMNREEIAFIHDATTGAEKDALFERCRNGRVKVLFGSTERMGTGTNVQKRAVALHHVDIPWRPADLEQREGRIIRQGNQNDQVEILNYITEGTFDVYMWQTVSRKAEFIAQVKHANIDARSVDDISSDFALMAAEMKALATGNPELIEYSQLVSDIHTLEVLERSHWDSMNLMRREQQGLGQEVALLQELAASVSSGRDRCLPTGGDAFAMQVGEVLLRERDTAARAITEAVSRHSVRAQMNQSSAPVLLAVLGGHRVLMAWNGQSMDLSLDGVRGVSRTWRADTWQQPGSGHGLVTRLENLVGGLDSELAELQRRLAVRQERQVQIASVDLTAPFEEADRLAALREKVSVLAQKLGMPSLEADSTEVVEDAPTEVMGEDLALLLNVERVPVNALRDGDVISIRDKALKGTYRVLLEGRETTDGIRLIDTAAGDEAQPVVWEYPNVSSYTLISRREEQLSVVERAMYFLPATDQICHDVKQLTVGDEITIRALGSTGPVELRAVIDSVQVDSTYFRPTAQLTMTDSQGQRHELALKGSEHRVVRHGVLDPVEEARKAAEQAVEQARKQAEFPTRRLLPGDTLLRDEPGIGARGDTVLSGLRDSTYGADPVAFYDPHTLASTRIPREYDREPRALQIAHGRELSADEWSRLYPGSPEGHLAVKDLRRGDRVLSTDLNPKAVIREEVHVLDIGYGSRHDIKYRPVDRPWEAGEEVKRMENQQVQVLGRRYGALNLPEFALLYEPERAEKLPIGIAAKSSDLDGTVDLAGSWVQFRGTKQRPKAQYSATEPGDLVLLTGKLQSIIEERVSQHTAYYVVSVEHDGMLQSAGTYAKDKELILFTGDQRPNQPDFRGMELPAEPTHEPALATSVKPAVSGEEFSISPQATVTGSSLLESTETPFAADERLPAATVSRDQTGELSESPQGSTEPAVPTPEPLADGQANTSGPGRASVDSDQGQHRSMLTPSMSPTNSESEFEAVSSPVLSEHQDASGAASPSSERQEPEPVEQPVTATEATEPVLIDHDEDHTLVSGTMIGSVAGRALKACGFKWSSRMVSWYLPRPWKMETRTRRITEVKRRFDTAGVTYALVEVPADRPVAPVMITPGMFLSVDPRRHEFLNADLIQLQDTALDEVVLCVESINLPRVEGTVRIGERSWPLHVNFGKTRFTPTSEQQAIEFSAMHAGGALVNALDRVLGVSYHDAEVGSVVTLSGHEYQGLETLESQAAPTQFIGAEVLSKDYSAASKHDVWAVNHQGTQKLVVLAAQPAGQPAVLGRGLLTVHDHGTGTPSVLLTPQPELRTVPLEEVQPGWITRVMGTSPQATFHEAEEIIEATGQFVGIQDAAHGYSLVTVLAEGEPTGVLVQQPALKSPIDVEIPVDSEPMVAQDVVEQFAAPVFSAPFPGVDRSHRRIMHAADVAVGSVLVNNAGVRVAVRETEVVSSHQVQLLVTDLENPSKQKYLTVPRDKQFSVEPMPVALGQAHQVPAGQLGVGYHWCQVWWDEASRKAGYHLTGASDMGEATRSFHIEDGSGQGYRMTVDSQMIFTVKAVKPDDKSRQEATAVVPAAVEPMVSIMEHEPPGAGM